MQATPSRTLTWPLAMTLAAIGGFAAAGGVLLGWWIVEGYAESEIFGRQLVEQQTLAGTAGWTGVVALLVGLAAGLTAVAALLFTSEGLRRAAGPLALVGGLAVLLVSGIGLAQAQSMAEARIAIGDLVAQGAPAFGLFLSISSGLVLLVAGFLARRSPAAEA